MTRTSKTLLDLAAALRGLTRQMPAVELAKVFTPPVLGYELAQTITRGYPEDAGKFDPDTPVEEVFAAVLDLGRWLGDHYFHADVSGVENVPEAGGGLLVANHSAGLLPLDSMFALNALRERFGTSRPVHSLVHDFAYASKSWGRWAHKLGIIRAKKSNTVAALDAGRLVLVYPGGDKDAFRPFSDRYKIELARRRGFVRIALEQKVPIIPLVSVGLHESFIVLTRGETLGRYLGMKKLMRTEVFPIALSLPWILAPAFFTFLPLPSKVDMRFGAPLYLKGNPKNPQDVSAGYEKVRSTMQRMMDELSKGRKLWRGRPERR